jgi:ABC-type lipoprotein export system ATPase subunit
MLNSSTNHRDLVRAENLSRVYQRGQEKVEALNGVNLLLPFHAFGVILGPSGGGKSTLLHLLGGMDRPTGGSLTINDFDLVHARERSLTSFRRDNIGFIFQFYNLLPSLSALDNVILPLLAKGQPVKQSREKAGALLDQVGLGSRIHHKPGQLSGGEQQRVAIARAIIVEPLLILADEPTGDLDSKTAQDVIGLMVEMNQRLGVTVLVATHNAVISNYATHHFTMKDGYLSREQSTPLAESTAISS